MQVLEVFGSGYTDDITPKKHRLRDKESHRLSAVKSIQHIQKMLEVTLFQLEHSNIFIHLPQLSRNYQVASTNVLKEQIYFLFQFLTYWFEQLEAIQEMN